MSPLSRRNVLISAAGRRVALLEIFREVLGVVAPDGAVVAGDVQALAAALYRADEAVVLPAADDANFGDAVFELCERHSIALVVPTIDTELAPYAQVADRLAAAGTTVAVSSSEVVEIAGSKRRTNQWLGERGFPVARQWSFEALGLAGSLPYPLIVKPDGGSSSMGLHRVVDEEGLRAAARGTDIVIEQVIEGTEYTVDVFVDRFGGVHWPVPRRRLEVRAGEVSKGLTARLPEVEALVCRLARDLPGARGCLNIQVMHDETKDTTAIIEINARFGGGYPLTHHAGAPYARWLVEEALGLAPTIPAALPWRPDTLMLRYDEAVFLENWRG